MPLTPRRVRHLPRKLGHIKPSFTVEDRRGKKEPRHKGLHVMMHKAAQHEISFAHKKSVNKQQDSLLQSTTPTLPHPSCLLLLLPLLISIRIFLSWEQQHQQQHRQERWCPKVQVFWPRCGKKSIVHWQQNSATKSFGISTSIYANIPLVHTLYYTYISIHMNTNLL